MKLLRSIYTLSAQRHCQVTCNEKVNIKKGATENVQFRGWKFEYTRIYSRENKVILYNIYKLVESFTKKSLNLKNIL